MGSIETRYIADITHIVLFNYNSPVSTTYLCMWPDANISLLQHDALCRRSSLFVLPRDPLSPFHRAALRQNSSASSDREVSRSTGFLLYVYKHILPFTMHVLIVTFFTALELDMGELRDVLRHRLIPSICMPSAGFPSHVYSMTRLLSFCQTRLHAKHDHAPICMKGAHRCGPTPELRNLSTATSSAHATLSVSTTSLVNSSS
jgi:hypothetical protein